MKTFFPCLLALILFPDFGRADLLVFRESERAHVFGAGRDVTVPVTTYTVYDTVTRSINAIGAFRIGPNRFYAITNSSDYVFTQGIAGRAGNYTVISWVRNTNSDPNTISASYFARGRE